MMLNDLNFFVSLSFADTSSCFSGCTVACLNVHILFVGSPINLNQIKKCTGTDTATGFVGNIRVMSDRVCFRNANAKQ